MTAAIHIVLVDTSHPGNIGASARAMKNMGMSSLVLVRPQSYPGAEATARASAAADLLAQARVEQSIDSAIAGCGLVLATSARRRSANWRVLDARSAATEILAASASRPVAVVFGGERNGLANEELARCHALIQIPANPRYESLNLAQAVQIVCYEIMMAQRGATDAAQPGLEAASVESMKALYRHLDSVLGAGGFVHPGDAVQLRLRIERLLARAVPDEKEVRILRGLLSAIGRCGQGPKR